MTCVPGAPGSPGRDGTKGDLGSPGKNGTQGLCGADGKKGAKGKPGIQGSPGQKGERGDKGDSGTPRLASHMNWKECAWKKTDENNTGLIYVSEQVTQLLPESKRTLLVQTKKVSYCKSNKTNNSHAAQKLF